MLFLLHIIMELSSSPIYIYYALIIGNNEYQDQNITSLNQPVKDANKLNKVLTTHYNFEKENTAQLQCFYQTQ